MYTVKEVAELLNINPHTVRYYANMDLIPNLHRDKNNVRLFDDTNISYMRGVIYLRQCGMSIAAIRDYFRLAQKGVETIPEQYNLIMEQKEKLDKQLKRLLESQKYLEEKIKLYKGYM